jgi:superfamily II DNA or RNA helicase
MTITLRRYQVDSISRLEEGFKSGEQRLGVALPTGAGKGHPLTTEVPTPDGLRLWGDLVVGDQVFGSDGLPTEVTAIYDRGVLPIYRVTLKHGETVEVDGDHLWQVHSKGRQPKVVSTRWLASQTLKDYDGWKFAVPVTGSVCRPDAQLSIDPYLVGSLIANGGLTHSGTILTTPDYGVIARIRAVGYTVNELPKYESRTCPAFSIPYLMGATRALGMRVKSEQKRIPRQYLEASVWQRTALLQGLFDADGSVRHGGRRSVRYSTTSPGLVMDITELVTSLGGTCSASRFDRTDEGKGVEYQLQVLLPTGIVAHSTSRKVSDSAPRRTFKPRSTIIDVQLTGDVKPIRCITVAADDHLYLITRNHIVTHNTVIMTGLAHRWSRTRTLILVHRDELIDQTVDKLRRYDRSLSVGVVKAARNEGGAAVVVASVQTICNPRRLAQLGQFGLVICDEAHRSMARQWQEPLETLGAFRDDGPRIAGFSATWSRSDKLELGDFWQRIVYRKSTAWAIEQGFLVPPIGKAVRLDFDLDGVSKSGGDYTDKALGIALTDETVAKAIVHAYRMYAHDRQGVLFAPTVASAEYFAGYLNAAGYTTECVFGTTSKADRLAIYERSRNGTTQIMASCGVLAEGFDAPWLQAAILARPTLHPGLFIQQVGRALRTSPETGKRDAIILDVVGATDVHKLGWWRNLAQSDPDDYKEPRDDDTDFTGYDSDPLEPAVRREARILGFEDVSLFGNQDAYWHRTNTGVMFVDTGDRLVFVEPAKDGTGWWVGETSKHTMADGKYIGWDFDTSAEAMDWAGEYAINQSSTTADRKAPWRARARRRAPSQQQVSYAYNLGIDNGTEMNAEELSDAITAVIGSRVLAEVRYPATLSI